MEMSNLQKLGKAHGSLSASGLKVPDVHSLTCLPHAPFKILQDQVMQDASRLCAVCTDAGCGP